MDGGFIVHTPFLFYHLEFQVVYRFWVNSVSVQTLRVQYLTLCDLPFYGVDIDLNGLPPVHHSSL